jgi:hypothetical protein
VGVSFLIHVGGLTRSPTRYFCRLIFNSFLFYLILLFNYLIVCFSFFLNLGGLTPSWPRSFCRLPRLSMMAGRQPVAAYGSVMHCLQCVAVCCRVLRCVAVCCNVLQCFAPSWWLVSHDSSTRMTWLIHMCDMTHLYVWHDSFVCVAWLTRMCAMTLSYVWHDSFKCVTRLIRMCDMTVMWVMSHIICFTW